MKPVRTGWHPAALLGTRLGSCVLERPLGGGMGAVYLARQERPHRLVAVKVLRPPETGNARAWPVFLARFRREADAMAALDHAQIVPIYEFGEQQGIAYLVMPYFADGSLDALLARTGPLPLERASTYLAQVAAALDYAHAHGIIHRDVKPSNLLIHPDGRLLLADFGIARPLARADHLLQGPGARSPYAPSASRPPASEPDDQALTLTGAPLGTPQYMAPEQIRGEAASAATDIYALGVLAYTLLAGRPPFDGGQTAELLRRQLMEAPRPLRSLRPDLPQPVDEAVVSALAKRPADRPTTAGRFVQALAAAGEGTAPSEERWTPFSVPAPTAPSAPVERVGPLAPDAPTLSDWSNSTGDRVPSRPPRWPLWPPADMSLPRSPLPAPRHRAHGLGRLGARAAIALGVVGILVLAPLLWALASGWAASSGPSAPAAPARIVPTATATVTPVPTPTPVANWLTIAPPSVRLDCSTQGKSVAVVLRNLGPAPTGWSSSVPFLGGVSIAPARGSLLASGHNVTITVTNTSIVAGHQGTITFTPTTAHAGRPAGLTYATQPCY